MTNTLIPEGEATIGATEGVQETIGEKTVSTGVDLESLYVSPDAVSMAPAIAKAARKWAAVLEFPCSSKSCMNLKGQPCTFHGGGLRQKPHDQRIEAATAAGAYVAGQRVPAPPAPPMAAGGLDA